MSSKLHRGSDAPPLLYRSAGGVSRPAGEWTARAENHIDEREVQARVAAAEQRAYAAGEAAGASGAMKRATEQVTPVLATLGRMIDELAKLRGNVRREAEAGTVELAMAVATRILNRELAVDPEAILGLVKSAGERLNMREIHKLRVSPQDFAVVDAQRARLNLPASVQVVSDPSLVPGSAIFETARGEVDASIQTQLEEIHRGLTDVVRRERAR
jgi:flagellar assembly protein FliH